MSGYKREQVMLRGHFRQIRLMTNGCATMRIKAFFRENHGRIAS